MSGIYISNIVYSDGSNLRYGVRPTIPSGSSNINQTFALNANEPIAGMWGYESGNVIKAFSPITLNLTKCLDTSIPPAQPDDSSDNSTSTTDSDNSQNQQANTTSSDTTAQNTSSSSNSTSTSDSIETDLESNAT